MNSHLATPIQSRRRLPPPEQTNRRSDAGLPGQFVFSKVTGYLFDDEESGGLAVAVRDGKEGQREDEVLVRPLTAEPASNYEAARIEAKLIKDAAIQKIISVVAPTVNARLQSMPSQSYDDKRSVCQWLNQELRELGIAIKCPKTGDPAALHASDDCGIGGRFRLRVDTPRGEHPTVSFAKLPTLSFVPARPRRESFVDYWSARRQSDSARDSSRR